MKAQHRKQRRKKTIGKSFPKLMPPVPPAEGEPTDRQTAGKPFDPSQLNMLCLTNPADPHSKFKIEQAMLMHDCKIPDISNLPEQIKKWKTLAVSKGVSDFEMANRGELPDFVFPPLLKPRVWLCAWKLVPQALAEMNAAYPGVIYTEPRFLNAIKSYTVQLYYGQTLSARCMASNWLKTVLAIPRVELPRRSKTKSGRSSAIHISPTHIWAIHVLYLDIVIIRKVLSKLGWSTDKLLSALPVLYHVRDRRLDWFNTIASDSKKPSPIDIACKILASIPESGLRGHKPESIHKVLERQSRNMTLNFISKLEKAAREAGKKIAAEFNKRLAEATPNATP